MALDICQGLAHLHVNKVTKTPAVTQSAVAGMSDGWKYLQRLTSHETLAVIAAGAAVLLHCHPLVQVYLFLLPATGFALLLHHPCARPSCCAPLLPRSCQLYRGWSPTLSDFVCCPLQVIHLDLKAS